MISFDTVGVSHCGGGDGVWVTFDWVEIEHEIEHGDCRLMGWQCAAVQCASFVRRRRVGRLPAGLSGGRDGIDSWGGGR